MVNKVILIGNLGKDPEVRTLESGVKYATFSIATNESYKDKNDQWQTQTEWHNIVAWRGLAELAEKYIKKGSQLYIEGKIQTRSWEKDGVKRYTTEIYAETIQLLGKRPEQPEGEASVTPKNAAVDAPSPEKSAPPVMEGEDDLPF